MILQVNGGPSGWGCIIFIDLLGVRRDRICFPQELQATLYICIYLSVVLADYSHPVRLQPDHRLRITNIIHQ